MGLPHDVHNLSYLCILKGAPGPLGSVIIWPSGSESYNISAFSCKAWTLFFHEQVREFKQF